MPWVVSSPFFSPFLHPFYRLFSPRRYVCILGILKSGAAYIPMDPEYPADRVAFTLNDAGASLLIASSMTPLFAAGDGMAGRGIEDFVG